MQDVIVIGASGHGAEIHDYIRHNENKTGIKSFNLLGYLEDKKEIYYDKYSYSVPYLGTATNHQIRHDCYYIIAIANVKIRKMVVEDFLKDGARFTSFIHCDAYISPSSEIGIGVVVGPYVNIGPNAKVGDFSLLNSRCSIAHDSEIGKYNFICPNVSFSGNTKVGDCNLFGINSATIPGINVGDWNKIEAGMIVDKDIENESVVFYRHKEKVIAIPKGSL